jgi:hypothetical protein
MTAADFNALLVDALTPLGRSLLLDEPTEARFQAYVDECEAENLEHHDRHMWGVHNEPKGPLG